MGAVAVQGEFLLATEGRHFAHANRQLEHPGIEVLDQHPVGLVILGLQPERVSLDPEVDVLGDENRSLFGMGLLHGDGQRDDPAVNVIIAASAVAVQVLFLENDPESSAVWQGDALAQAPLPAQIPPPDAKAILAEYERPKFLTDRKAQYAEALKKHRGVNGDEPPEPEYQEADGDDIPF